MQSQRLHRCSLATVAFTAALWVSKHLFIHAARIRCRGPTAPATTPGVAESGPGSVQAPPRSSSESDSVSASQPVGRPGPTACARDCPGPGDASGPSEAAARSGKKGRRGRSCRRRAVLPASSRAPRHQAATPPWCCFCDHSSKMWSSPMCPCATATELEQLSQITHHRRYGHQNRHG
jgi:hypothetical protein